MVAFGKPFISNRDLVIRLFLGARLAVANREMFYGGGEEGYTDYQVLRSSEPVPCYQDHERAWAEAWALRQRRPIDNTCHQRAFPIR